MEAAIANLLEPGEKIIVGNKGIWGTRVADLAQRYGGERGGWTEAWAAARRGQGRRLGRGRRRPSAAWRRETAPRPRS